MKGLINHILKTCEIKIMNSESREKSPYLRDISQELTRL